MSTPRTRSRVVDSTGYQIKHTGGFDVFGNGVWMYPPTLFQTTPINYRGLISFGQTTRTSVIDDYVSPKPHPAQFCRHLPISRDWSRSVLQCVSGNTAYNAQYAVNIPVMIGMSQADLDHWSSVVSWPSLLVDLVSQVRNRLDTGYLAGATLAEFAKTVEMIKNPFGLMRTDWRNVVADLSAKALAKKSANLWLEHQYGWRALSYDIKSFVKATCKYDDAMRNHMSTPVLDRYRKRSWLTLYSAMRNAYFWTSSGGSWPQGQITAWPGTSGNWYAAKIDFSALQAVATVGCLGADTCEDHHNHLTKALQAFGGDIKGLFDTIWELTPYSFVVDWFINTKALRGLGSALNVLQSARCSDLTYSVKLEQVVTAWCLPGTICFYSIWPYNDPWLHQPTGRWPLLTNYDRPAIMTNSVYVRNLGLPGLSLNQFLSTDLTATQLASGAGLLIQRLKH